MSDDLRDEFTALGQRLMHAEVQRRDAMERIRVLVRRHGQALEPSDLSQWTTLETPAVEAMFRDQ